MLQTIRFDPGNRHEDFDSSTDEVAAYGKKVLLGPGVAAAAAIYGLFRRRRGQS